MTTANNIPTAAEQMIHQRLDAIDRALLGWLPRTERLALVAQVEARARELATGPAGSAPATANCLELADAVAITGSSSMSAISALPTACRRRSGMALTAGILGIVALVLLFATPVSYLIAGFLGDMIGEMGAIALLGVHLGIVTLGGLAAVALGTAALVKLKRRHGALGGHAWAITGLCTGPWPLLGGAVVGIILGVELMGSTTMCSTVSEDGGYVAPEGISISPATGLPVGYVAGGLVGSAQDASPGPLPPRCMAEPPARASVGPDELPVREAPPFEPVQPFTDEAPPFEGPARPEPPSAEGAAQPEPQVLDQRSNPNSISPVTATSNSIPKKSDLPDLPTGAGPIDPDAPAEFTGSKSGLCYRILRKSSGRRPNSTNRVLTHYKGWLNDGQQFDSSYDKGTPSEFPLNEVIAGWTEGLQLVSEGGMIELEVPPRLGYGAIPCPGIPANSTLHFIVELKEIRAARLATAEETPASGNEARPEPPAVP